MRAQNFPFERSLELGKGWPDQETVPGEVVPFTACPQGILSLRCVLGSRWCSASDSCFAAVILVFVFICRLASILLLSGVLGIKGDANEGGN